MHRFSSRHHALLMLGGFVASCATEPDDPTTTESIAAETNLQSSDDRDDREQRDHHDARSKHRPIRSLADAAARTDRLIGTAVDTPFLTGDPVYAQTLASEFSYLTPGNETKWGSLQPVDSAHWEFAPADAIMSFARHHHLAAKGHVLIWHSQLPPFVNDTLAAEDLVALARRNIREVMRRYRQETRAWDVVNEAFEDDGTLRDTVFLRKLGPGYIADAFRWAREEDRRAVLYYNDFNIDTINAKSNAVYDLVRGLIADHVPIDGVGFQMHLEAQSAPSTEEMVANLKRFTDLGLRVNISELDVRIANAGGDLVTRLALQRQVFHRAVAACVQVPGCETLTTWGFTDLDSWIDATFGPDDPLELDEQYRRKPAYYGIIDGFLDVPVDPPGTPPNMIANGSFEIGNDGWAATGGKLSTSHRTAHTGERSARLRHRTQPSDGIVFDALSVATAATTYDVSAWVRISRAASDSVTLTATTRCAGGTDIETTLATSTASSTAWLELTGELVVPDCVAEAISLEVAGPAPRVELLVDDAALRRREQLGPNLIANPGFEVDTTGWFGFGGVPVSSTADQAHSGARSGLATARTATFQGPAIDLRAAGAIPGATYQARAWLRIAGTPLTSVAMTLKSTCDGTTTFQRIGITTASDGGWSLLIGSIVLPTCAATELTAYFEGPPAGVDIYIDDASVRQDLSVRSPNAIANPDFESGTTSGWFGFGSPTVTATTAQAHAGRWSLLATNRTATFMGPGTDIRTAVSPGVYQASAWVRLDGATASPVFMTAKITCTDAADQFVQIGTANATDSAWTQLTGPLTVPTCPLSGLIVYLEGAPVGVNEYIDDVVLRR